VTCIPVREIRIKTYLEMLRDGILAFVDSGGDPNVDMDTALSTYVYCDDLTDVPDHAPVYPRDNTPKDLKHLNHLNDILRAFADDRGWDEFVLGDEL